MAYLGPRVLQQGVDHGVELLKGSVPADLHAPGDADPRLGGQLDEAGNTLFTVLALNQGLY